MEKIDKVKELTIEYWRNDIQKWVNKLPKSFKDKLVKTRWV